MKRTRLNLARLLLAAGVAFTALPACSNPDAAAQKSVDAGFVKVATDNQPRKAQLIAELLTQYHYRQQDIDDALAHQALDLYIKSLDQDRYYFLKQDVDAFVAARDQLDDELLKGDLKTAYRIFDLYRTRVQERTDFALAALNQAADFKPEDRFELDRTEAPYAASKAELDALWLKRVRHDFLTLQMSGQEPAKVREILTKRYQRLAQTVQKYSSEEIFQTYMNAWTQVFDPHTAYMSPKLSENFDIHMRLSLEGIGAMLKSENEMTEVVELVPGGPAAKSGQLQPGDRIIGVGEGVQGEIVDVVGWRLTDVVDLIRGPKSTTVRLQILPKHGAESAPKVITLMRNQVQLEEQAAKAKVIEFKDGERTARIGVIKLPAFYIDFAAADAGKKDYRSTTRDVRRLIDELKAQGVDGLVVDLRGNGGGSLREAADLTGLFIHGGPVVQVRRQDGDVEVLADRDPGVAYEGPLAVLVDRFSASASEIFAGAIQDYGRGVVIGQPTFGKGTVQTLVDLDRFGFSPREPGGRLKLTIAKFYRVSGHSTQQRGITPDILLPSPTKAEDFGESSEKTALPWDEIKAVSFKPEGSLMDVLPVLKQRHEQRMKQSPAFQALLAEYQNLQALAERKSIPLHEQARKQERERTEAQQLALVNQRLSAYGLEPLKSLEGFDQEKQVPDTVVETAAAVVADLTVLKRGVGLTASNWSLTKNSLVAR